MFSLPLTINYEDTDAGGVVYYANYLAYMERARNACLRHMGYPLTELIAQHKMMFVVAEANLKYRKPARLDDTIDITVGVTDVRSVSIRFVQRVLLEGELLVEATLKLGTLHSDTFLPCKIPAELRDCFEQQKIEYAGN